MRQVTIFLTALTVFAVCSCSSKTITDFPSGIYVPDPLRQIEQNLDKNETVTRKIIKEGKITFRTADVDQTKALIVQTVQELNGYISKENVYDDDDEQVKHSLTIRVPADKFDILLSTISASIDRIEYKSIDVLDVTEEFVDIESRIKTKKELQSRYKELLSKATKVEEMLQIERELGELQTEIESVEGRMKVLKDRIDFSTLTVTYYQKTTFKFGFSAKFVDGIKNGWNVFLWFIIGLSHIWVFILITTALIITYKRWRKKRRAS